MNLGQAEKAIRNAWIASSVGVVIRILTEFINIKVINPVLIMPWFCPGRFFGLELILVLFFTFMLYKKSRIFSILLFVLFLLDRANTFILLGGFYLFPFIAKIIWLGISIFFGYFLFQGIRGAFVYHKLKA